MKKIMLITSIVLILVLLDSRAKAAGEYDAQIEALQNELLKTKQEMSSDKNKAYFKKGKGLSIKSTDGKHSFQIKGRAMYDMGLITANTFGALQGQDSFGSEFRRLRFSIKANVGDGWGFAFQPDFAETVSDNVGGSSSGPKGVDVKDAIISKKLKGFGKVMVGNQKAAAGMWENTSSNSLLFMERPMHNEAMNWGHRTGIGYDSAGAFGKKSPFHLRATAFVGAEGAFRQEMEDASTDVSEEWGFTGAGHYSKKLGKKHQAMVGFHYAYMDKGNSNSHSFGVRANGLHMNGEKFLDGTVSNIDSFSFYGPQFAYTNGPLFIAGEYQKASGDRIDYYSTYDDYEGEGMSLFAHYFVNGDANVKISNKRGSIGGIKCKSQYGCTALKVMYEKVDMKDSELSEGDGFAVHIGVNHYFNSNVRIMVDVSRGIYLDGDDMAGSASVASPRAYTNSDTASLTAIQARLHLKF
jgi:phosphate-selective porin OprO and OprP